MTNLTSVLVPWSNMQGSPFAVLGIAALVLAVIWSAIWKAIALWKAARAGSLGWFIALLVVNTLGILDILYIYIFSKKTDGGNSGII